MRRPPHPNELTRRERQAMDILYAAGKLSAADLHGRLPDPPSYSSVRSTLRLLEQKGLVHHVQDGPRYVYLPTVPRERARRSALDHLLHTFFDGSVDGAVAALLDGKGLPPEEVERILAEIEKARREGR